jgi:murein DD-endopeptidase MepM/ murein hydrolase activator NlpD
MEIINYFEAPGYEGVRIKRNIKIPSLAFETDEIKEEIHFFGLRLVNAIHKHRILAYSVLVLYGLILMNPFIQENVLRFFKTVSVKQFSLEEKSLLDSSMEKFVLMHGVDNTITGEESLSYDLGVSIPQILQPVSYSTYRVGKGDNITNIAKKFGLSNISTLIAVNDISNVRLLQAGQKLIIPSMDGLYHTVKSGESLETISKKYSVSLENMLDVNDLTTEVIHKGDKLFIPGARLDSVSLREAMGETFKCPIYARWRMSSAFGPRIDPIANVKSFHTGMDFACPSGTEIHCAMAGKVVFTGYNNIYGNYVIVNHGNGYQSLYAHMLKYVVKTGQWVDQGTKLGNVGSTGYSTGPHLHLSIYKNGKLVNPASLIKY